jgi:hypothetical protein
MIPIFVASESILSYSTHESIMKQMVPHGLVESQEESCLIRNFARRGDGSGLKGLGLEKVRLCEEEGVVGSGKHSGWLVRSSEMRLAGRNRDERLRRWPVGKRKGGSGEGRFQAQSGARMVGGAFDVQLRNWKATANPVR